MNWLVKKGDTREIGIWSNERNNPEPFFTVVRRDHGANTGFFWDEAGAGLAHLLADPLNTIDVAEDEGQYLLVRLTNGVEVDRLVALERVE